MRRQSNHSQERTCTFSTLRQFRGSAFGGRRLRRATRRGGRGRGPRGGARGPAPSARAREGGAGGGGGGLPRSSSHGRPREHGRARGGEGVGEAPRGARATSETRAAVSRHGRAARASGPLILFRLRANLPRPILIRFAAMQIRACSRALCARHAPMCAQVWQKSIESTIIGRIAAHGMRRTHLGMMNVRSPVSAF